MDIIDQLYNSHVSAATLDALDKYRMHKDRQYMVTYPQIPIQQSLQI